LSSASRSSIAAAISLNTPNDSALSIFGRFFQRDNADRALAFDK